MSDTETISIAPTTGILESWAKQNLKWAIVLGELIDNSLDSQATSIAIEFTRDAMVVTDNGKGCKHPAVIVQPGAHEETGSKGLGRYGIGAKHAMVWVGGTRSVVEIKTVHEHVSRTLLCPWREVANNGWRIQKPVEAVTDKGSGTVIRVSPLKTDPPHGQDWKFLLSQLGYLYSIALKRGAEIRLKRPRTKGTAWDELERWRLPEFDGDVVDTRISVGGREARVHVGVVKEGVSNPRSGFTYYYSFRVIEQQSANGCGEYSSTRICGVVELIGKSWELATNKDAIGETQRKHLYDEVLRVARPVLERAHARGSELAIRGLEERISQHLNTALENRRRAKAKRRPPKNHDGTVPSGDGTKKHTKAENEQSGDTFDSRHSVVGQAKDEPATQAWRVLYASLGTEQPLRIGEVKHLQIHLNQDHPFVSALQRTADERVSSTLALCLLASSGFRESGKRQLSIVTPVPEGVNAELYALFHDMALP